ncbi:MAG: GTP cyclohydrolase I FolE [Dehalococcoidales bacterium]|jgi:GTP cyclohydrolase I
MYDAARINAAVKEIIECIGADPSSEGMRDTPQRVAEMYAELFQGIDKNPGADLKVGFELGHREMVVVKDIPFYSMCEHHLLPFFGVVHVGYIPNKEGRIVGISKIARVVETIARRPQVQERITTEIADTVFNGLNATGTGVVVQAEHMCMIMRGIKKPGSNVITSALRGTFKTQATSRAEFFSLIQMK